MGRLLSIDYGRKRCGIAVTDSLKLVANGLTTVATAELIAFIKSYLQHNDVEAIIVGYPTTLKGEESESMKWIRPGVVRLAKEIPGIEIKFYDERFTSVLAHQSMLSSGMKKKARRDKTIVDEISAAILLNDYLSSKHI